MSALFTTSAPVHAAVGINQEMNFQGRLLNSQGAIVPDGYYNVEFKIYQDGDGQTAGDTTGTPAGTLLWTEDYVDNNANAGVQVVNGYMSVQLGSICAFGGGSCQGHTNAGVNWDSDTLWLSMNIAGDNNACTAFGGTNCTADGEMVPMKRLSANAYAMNALAAINSQQLGGINSGNYVQFADGTLQSDSTAFNSIYINKTGTGNIIDLQTSGVDSFMVNNSGNVVFGANATHTLSVATAAASTAGQALTLSAGSAGSGTAALTGGTLTLDAGTGGGTNGNGGNLVLDAGAPNGTGTAGTITVGGNYASSVQLGNVSITTQVKQVAGGATSTLSNTGGQAIVGSDSTSATTALKVSNSSNVSLFQITDDGAVDLGVDSLNNPALIINTSGQITTATTVNTTSPVALLVQSSSTGEVLDVDTTNNQILIGQAGHVNGLVALESTTGGYVGLAAPSIASGSSYSLNFPSSAPTATNQCLQTSSTFTQLAFGPCGTTGSFINNAYGTTQAGNFNIQGVSSTVATAVIEANNGGTGDILDLLNGAGTAVATFDSNGNLVDSATGTSSFAGTLSVATDVITPTLDTASAVPLNIGASSSQINLNQNVVIANGANRSISVAAATTGNGNDLSMDAGAGASGGNNNGGNVNIDAGARAGTGVDGTINIGTNHASAINIGTSGVTTTNNGNEAVSGQIAVGKSGVSNGTVVFNTSAGPNAITLNTASSAGTYTLTLPTSAPAAGLCLETSPGASSQLVFASCTNNNSSIQEVQEHDANNATSVPFSPTTVGDEIVVTTQIPTSGVTVSSITGGEVTSWNKVVAQNGNGIVNRVEMWVGTVTSLGSTAISVTYTGGTCPTTGCQGSNEITATEFTAAGVNSSTSWGIESSNALTDTTASATVTYPSATSVDGSELYIGYAQVQNPPATAGTTTSFNYIQTSTQHNMLAYDTNLTANTVYQPTANQYSAGESNTVDAVLTAFVTSTSINNTTSLQKANFYVQAASSGTVAGILQAASSGTADIFDIKNSGGTANYLQVGSTGNFTLSPVTSTTALQVVNSTSGYNVFSVDTTNNQAVLGSSTHVAGTLTFDDASDSNTISLQAPTSIAASYTLAMPTNSPTAGLCLGTSPSNANQLIFASCATQVSAAGISFVNNWSATGTGTTAVSDSPSTKGDLLVLYSHSSSTTNVSVSSISGGGVNGWTKVTAYNSAGGAQGDVEMWRGVVNTTGAGTVTVTYSGTITASDVSVEEYTMGSSSGTWAIDTSGTGNSTSTTAIDYPTLTAQNSSELYTGYAWGANTMSAGTTTGFTWVATAASKYIAYDTNVTGGLAYTPAASQATAGAYASIGAMVEAYAGTSVIVDTTATQEANFNVQASTAGTVAGVLQEASSGTADIFDARDANGNNIVAINATSGLTLGTPNTVGGQLNFNAGGNGNTISIQAPTAPGSNYSLILPTTTPAAGQCLASSPNNANQLVFSSCANQVTSVAISFVNSWNASGSAITTLAVSPATAGDIMVLFASPGSAKYLTSVSGGGVSSWAKTTGTTSGSGTGTSAIEMWRGIITTAGASTITVAWSSSPGTSELAAMEFTTGSNNSSWVVDTSNAQYNGTSSTSVAYPTLTPQSTKDLYVGYAGGGANMSAGTTPGFTYLAGNQTTRQGIYNTAVSAAVSPTGTQASSTSSVTVGALIAAYSASSVIANSTVTQEANFNVQAATSGSVAGILQAASAGTGDILDFLDGAGSIVDSFGSAGNLLVKPSTASSAALQVQTTGGVNVLSVDTSAKLVNIGTGATGEASPSLLVLDSETGSSADPAIASGSNSSGAMYYNATTNAFRCSIDGIWENCNSLLYANTSASTAINNCTTNCAAFSTTTTIPANYCQAGRVIDLFASGYFSSQATATTLQFGVYYGTDGTTAANDTLLGTLTPSASVTAANNNYFQMNFNINCYSTSSMQSGGLFSIQTSTSGSGMLTLPMAGSVAGTTVVTSTAKNLYIFPIWGAASTSNTATLSQLTVNNY